MQLYASDSSVDNFHARFSQDAERLPCAPMLDHREEGLGADTGRLADQHATIEPVIDCRYCNLFNAITTSSSYYYQQQLQQTQGPKQSLLQTKPAGQAWPELCLYWK